MPVITLYAGARRPEPVDAQDLTWPEIAYELEGLANEPPDAPEDADIEEQKKRMPAWAPHALTPGATRGMAGVAHVSMLVVDVDHGGDPEAVAAALEANGLAGLLYESAKSTPEAPRFRIVCPITEPISPADCRATRYALAEALGLQPGCGVEGAIDASKIFFSGRAHGTPERRVWNIQGEALDPGVLPPIRLPWAAPHAAVASPHIETLPPADQGLVAALGPWQQHAGRKWMLCGALGGLLRKLAYSPAQCEAVIRAWLADAPPDVDVSAGVAWALGAWNKEAADVSGHGELARVVGDAHARIVESAAQAGSWAGRAARRAPLAPPPTAWMTPVTGGSALGRRLSYSDPEVPLEYYCAGLCLTPSDGKISLIAGLPGAGKGPIAAHLAVCFTFGLPAFGLFPCRKSRVLVLDCEGARLTMRRTRRMCRALGIDPKAMADPYDVTGTALLSDTTFRAIQAEDPEIVILDSYTSAMLATGLDSNKPEFAQLAQLLGALGILVISVAHANKAPAAGERPTLQQVAGSFALAAMAQTGIAVWHPDAKDSNRVQVACMRAPETSFETFDLAFEDVAGGDGLALRGITAAEVKATERKAEDIDTDRCLNAILGWLDARPGPWPRKFIADSVIVHGISRTGQMPERDVMALLQRLCSGGMVVAHLGTGKGGQTYEIVGRAPAYVAMDAAGDVRVAEAPSRVRAP